MRLIDADYFKERIAVAYIKNNMNTDSGLALLELIDSVPTAYDVNKVVEQLLGNNENIRANPRQSTINLEEAVRIVKKGGANE